MSLVAVRAHRELILSQFTEAVWFSLIRQPSLFGLPGEVYAEIAEEIRGCAGRRLTAAAPAGAGPLLVSFSQPGGFEGFQVEVAGAIVCRLGARLGDVNCLNLITATIPSALAATLAGQRRPDGLRPDQDYRLAGATA